MNLQVFEAGMIGSYLAPTLYQSELDASLPGEKNYCLLHGMKVKKIRAFSAKHPEVEVYYSMIF